MALLNAVPRYESTNGFAVPLLYIFIVVVVVVIFISKKLVTPEKESREPPVARQHVPFIGHILGMLRYKGDYLKSLR
jgi:hypothetical protein